MYPPSTAVLPDFSSQMMGEGEHQMQPFAGRFHDVEFDTSTGAWPGKGRSRSENHVRYIVPLSRQLGCLRSAGLQGIDVFWKHLESVIYGGCPAATFTDSPASSP